ncbi:hypothetical protein [Gillisia sp. Hel_I_29]|uniref:hypothetical protein n=1 Tax=Gillisia sp. Hel_I_29 TaxID=1249975 RepID=UPI000552351F|nr:hypothetical protein [Gillisia sp. Hel_I_29]
MALEAVINTLKEAGEKIAKDGIKKGVEGLKEGQGFKEALKGSFDTAKETAFSELDKILSTENQTKVNDATQKVDGIQDKLEREPEKVEANPSEEIKGINEVTENVNDVAKDIKEDKTQELTENADPSYLSEIKNNLQEFKEVLKEVQEVQEKLKELGVNPDMLSMLNAEAMEIDEMEDLEEEGEGTE